MQDAIKQKYSFDNVYDSQKLFRLILEAMSNPTRRLDISPFTEGFQRSPEPRAFALAQVLLDQEVSFVVRGDDTLASELHQHTGARIGELETADFVLVTDPDTLDGSTLQALKPGTIDYPEHNATLICLLGSTEMAACHPDGPGIKGTSEIELEASILRIQALIAERRIGYPCGIDTLYVTEDHQLIAWPRTLKAKETHPWHTSQ